MYLDFYSLVVKCMELSFNSLARLIKEINQKYALRPNDDFDDEPLELYPWRARR